MDNCPHCSVAMERVFERQHIEVPSIAEGWISKLLVRFPLMKCPICKERFGTKDTDDTIQQAVMEFVNRDIKKILPQREKIEKRIQDYDRRHFLLMGFSSAMFISSGINLIGDHHWWLASFMLGMGLSIFTMYYISLVPIAAFAAKLLKKIKK